VDFRDTIAWSSIFMVIFLKIWLKFEEAVNAREEIFLAQLHLVLKESSVLPRISST
jgi:hypothetical protein